MELEETERDLMLQATALGVDVPTMRDALSSRVSADRSTLSAGVFAGVDAETLAELLARHTAQYDGFCASVADGTIVPIMAEGAFLVEASVSLLSLLDDALLATAVLLALQWTASSCDHAYWVTEGSPRRASLQAFPVGTSVDWLGADADRGLVLANCVARVYGELFGWMLSKFHHLLGAAQRIAAAGNAVLARDLFHLKHMHWKQSDLHARWLAVVRGVSHGGASPDIIALWLVFDRWEALLFQVFTAAVSAQNGATDLDWTFDPDLTSRRNDARELLTQEQIVKYEGKLSYVFG
jgi:hypothetical protein